MKRLLLLFSICTLFGTQTEACIDSVNDVFVIVSYDTIWDNPCAYTDEIEIRLSNLRMMNESPNKICACALAHYQDFSQLHYIAMVDSGTNDPYDGFAGFTPNSASSAAWNASQPGFGGWGGYIADVINGGLTVTSPVELVIRAKMPTGTQLSFDSLCATQNITSDLVEELDFGKDAWDPISESLDESHQGVLQFDQVSAITYTQVSSQTIEDLDDDVLNNMPVDTNTCKAAFSYTVSGDTVFFSDESNSNANQYVVWDFGDGTPHTIFQDPIHIYGDTGTYTVCLYNINNGDTCSVTCIDVLVDSADSGVGITEFVGTSGFNVYPNPASSELNFEWKGSETGISKVELVNLLGKTVRTYPLANSGQINVDGIAPGMYFLQAEIGGEVRTSDMIVLTP